MSRAQFDLWMAEEKNHYSRRELFFEAVEANDQDGAYAFLVAAWGAAYRAGREDATERPF